MMFKKVLLIIGLTTGVFSKECSTLQEEFKSSASHVILVTFESQPIKYCKVADAMEIFLNKIGALRSNGCIDKYTFDKSIADNTPLLVDMVQKCGH